MGSLATSRFGVSLFATGWLLLAGCATVHLMQAENAYRQGHYEDAKSLAENAVREDPRSVPVKKLLAKILVHFGADALEKDDLEAAKRYFEEASNYYPAEPNLGPYLELVRNEEQRREASVSRHHEASRYQERDPSPRQKEAPKPAKPANQAPAKEALPEKGLTVVQESPLYDAPSPFAAKVGSVSAGARLGFIREAGGWYEVETKDGRRGYVRGEALKTGHAP